jgi:hypothetical protein
MSFKHVGHLGGAIPFANIDTGTTMADGSTVVPSGPHQVGDIADGHSATYGGGEFILLPGFTGCEVGTVVRFNADDYTTAVIGTTSNSGLAVAVSMAANTDSTAFSWYQIYGKARAQKTLSGFTSADKLYIGVSVGKFSPTSVGANAVTGGLCAANAASAASAGANTLVTVSLSYPMVIQSI